jgi:hypothetical protein
MTKRSRVRLAVLRALLLPAGLLFALVAATTALERPNAQEQPGRQATSDDAQAEALQEFQTRMEQYLDMREHFSRTLQPLSTAPDGAELTTRQGALAAAIKNARARARRGDLLPRQLAQQIATTVRHDFQRRNPTAKMGVFEEAPETPGSSLINRTYPPGDALPPVPPLLLMNLPKLPDNLQYRLVARDLVILDGDLRVVLDYIARVLPVH